MVNSSLLIGLLNRASNVFSLAGELGRSIQEERNEQGEQVVSSAWNRHSATFDRFWSAILDESEVMQNPPDGFHFTSQIMVKAARIAKRIREAIQGASDANSDVYFRFADELIAVSNEGQNDIFETTKRYRLDDPLPFVDTPSKVVRPLGWEGRLPDEGILSKGVLRRYLMARLFGIREIEPGRKGEYFKLGREALRNSLRGSDFLNLEQRPNPWPGDFDGITPHELEQRLSELWRWLDYAGEGQMPKQPASETSVTESVNASAAEKTNELPKGSAPAVATTPVPPSRTTPIEPPLAEKQADPPPAIPSMVVSKPVGTGDDKPTTPLPSVATAVLSLYTNGIADERLAKVTEIVQSKRSVNEKIGQIDKLMRIPPSASAKAIGDMLGVSKTAVTNTEWWKIERKGKHAETVEERRKRLSANADQVDRFDGKGDNADDNS